MTFVIISTNVQVKSFSGYNDFGNIVKLVTSFACWRLNFDLGDIF